jgi:glucose/arabinose dehydrogenase
MNGTRQEDDARVGRARRSGWLARWGGWLAVCGSLIVIQSVALTVGPLRGRDIAASLALAQTAPAPSPFSDYRFEQPGTVHRITVRDLPAPYATRSAANGPRIVPRPQNAWPVAPAGFKVELYATGLIGPRVIRRAPNGDLFVTESAGGRISVLRGISAAGKPERVEVFAEGLARPYGIAFYPPGSDPKWVYVGDTSAVVRFAYRTGQLRASGPAQRVAELPDGGGHWTRDLQFSKDGATLFVAVGSASNIDDPDSTPGETGRADILAFDPDGSHRRVYAWGLRNPSGLAIDPATGQLWCTVNERDGLGDNLVPDYITHVEAGGFYGWPWWYLGAHQDPRHAGKRPDLARSAIVPDVLLQPHNAPLQIAFYQGQQLPAEYRGHIFAALHGSWNRSVRTGYEVIRVPVDGGGHASGDYQDFLTGFVVDDQRVWGRPVGIAEAQDGSLMVSDDGSNSIWRVRYEGHS